MRPVADGAAPGPVAVRRATVHTDPQQRGGTAHARLDARSDLRLVPPALAVWATAALTLGAPPGWTAGTVVACLVAGVVLLRLGRVRTRPGTVTAGVASARPGWRRASVGALLLCVAGAAASAGLHGADVRRGPVPARARDYATVTAEVELTGDPRAARPRV
ncbi:MBL fold metallo-hydrolase, partial [Streptomyces sp. NPDC059627]